MFVRNASCFYLACSIQSVYTEVSDGKGGKVTVKKQKLTQAEKIAKAKAEKKAKEAISKIKGGKFADVEDFSDASTDSDLVDLSHMTEEEKRVYLEARAKRKAEREKRRREKYGDKYDLMVEKQKEFVVFLLPLAQFHHMDRDKRIWYLSPM